MPPPVVGLVNPPASPTTSSRSANVLAIGFSGSRRRTGGGGVASSRAVTCGRVRNRSRKAPALPVAITPIFSRARPSRTIGTVHTKPLGASSRPKWMSTTSPGIASTSVCAV